LVLLGTLLYATPIFAAPFSPVAAHAMLLFVAAMFNTQCCSSASGSIEYLEDEEVGFGSPTIPSPMGDQIPIVDF
jgi:hypothetical protein